MQDTKVFWDNQTSSLNRSSNPDFYRAKALEHAALFSPSERAAGCIDLGCGAGEMLVFFADSVRVKVGLDYSESMLTTARSRLAGKDIELTSANAFDYLETTDIPVWTTTGALNQYLPAGDLSNLVRLFARNPSATTFALFDCINPIQYRSLSLGGGARAEYTPAFHGSSLARRTKHVLRRLSFGASVAVGVFDREVQSLNDPAMGFAVAPGFWLREADAHGLSIEIVSSRFYEYRYHVFLRKPAPFDG